MRAIGMYVSLVALSFGIPSKTWAGIIFTNRTAWESAIMRDFQTETFSTLFTNRQVLVLDSGIVSTAVGSLHANFVNSALEFNGGASQFGFLQWTFPSNVFAFGGDFRSIGPAPDGLSLVGVFDETGEQTISIAGALGGPSGFLGIVGTVPIDSIKWVAPNRSGSDADAFQIDNFSFASVPEPSGSVISCGLILLAWFRRYRSSKSAKK